MMRNIQTAIVIPARNEERRIGACLEALGPQLGDDTLIVLVANNCTDATEARARAAMGGPALFVANLSLAAGEGVGTARRLGCDIAMKVAPDLRLLMTTDADCVVSPDWVTANIANLRKFDAVCGTVDPLPAESDILKDMPALEGQNEADYRNLVLRFYNMVHPEPHNPVPHHGEAPGASLAIRLAAYRQIGGFADRQTGEDRDLIRRARRAGLKVRHASDVRVAASCRLTGRAKGGMADTLRDRLASTDYRVDDALPPAGWLLDRAACGALPEWPPELPSELCLRPSDLPEQIALLSQMVDQVSGPGAGAIVNIDRSPIAASPSLFAPMQIDTGQITLISENWPAHFAKGSPN